MCDQVNYEQTTATLSEETTIGESSLFGDNIGKDKEKNWPIWDIFEREVFLCDCGLLSATC